MANSSTNSLLVAAILLAAIGCTERPPNDPADSPAALAEETPAALAEENPAPAEEKPAAVAEESSSSRTEAPLIDLAAGERTLNFERNLPRKPRRQFTPEEQAMIDRALSEVGPIELKLDDAPATFDPIEPGRYLFTTAIHLSQGQPVKQNMRCRVYVDGIELKIQLENPALDPIIGTLQNGEFFSDPEEAPGTYGLEGKVVGPNKMRGVIIPGPIPHPSVDIIQGRWGLDALPLPDGSIQ